MSGNVFCKYEVGAYGIPGDNSTLMDDGKYHATGTRKCIIVRSGHNSDGTGVGPLQGGFFFELTRGLIDAGFTVYCIDAGGPNSWWNAASTTALKAAISHLQSLFGITKVGLFGGSMGGGVCIQALKDATVKANVCGVATISAPVDLDYAHGTAGYTPPYTYDTAATPTFGDWQADCEAADAYNTNAAGWAAATVGHHIWDEPASWRGLPFPLKLWHGDRDQVVPYAMAQWWVGQVNDPQVTLRTLPGAFHTPPTPEFLGPPTAEYIDFFNSLTWS
jgi:pimeloyl-ACP methyl ester carboxylesterase